jgi:hypothetical protein
VGTNAGGVLKEGQKMNERLCHKATYAGKNVNGDGNNLHITYVKMVSKVHKPICSCFMDNATLQFNRWNISPHNTHKEVEY